MILSIVLIPFVHIPLFTCRLLHTNKLSIGNELLSSNKICSDEKIFEDNRIFCKDQRSHDSSNHSGSNTLDLIRSQSHKSPSNHGKITANKICLDKLSSIITVFPEKNPMNFFKHTWNLLKLLSMVPNILRQDFRRCAYYSTLGALLSTTVVLLCNSERVYGYLRSKWAFQGELYHRDVEEYTRLAMAIYTLDIAYRLLILRLNLYSLMSDGEEPIAMAISKFYNDGDYGTLYKVFNIFTQLLISARIISVSFIHYSLFLENWNTASFIIDPKLSKSLSKAVFAIFLLSLFEHSVTSLLTGSFSSFLDIDHAIDPTSYRDNKIKIGLYNEARRLVHSIPDIAREVLIGNATALVNFLFIIDYIRRFLPSNIEWLHLLFNLSLSLYSNSAAGLYLSAAQFACNIINDQICAIEKYHITKDIEVT